MYETGHLLHAAQRAAQIAAEHIRAVERPAAGAAWERKGLSDFVTQVDREAEQLIAESLMAACPGTAVVGEELTPHDASDGLVWIVDPLDGTTNYLHAYPAYAVSIAAVFEGTPMAAVVADVSHDITYHATRGGGAWCGDRPLSVSTTDDPALALIGTGFPFKALAQLPDYLRQFTAVLRRTSGVRRAGSAALDLSDVAAGRFDGFWEASLAPWDVAAGTLLAREAGGVVTDLAGSADVIRHGPIVAGNPAIHRWLLENLAC